MSAKIEIRFHPRGHSRGSAFGISAVVDRADVLRLIGTPNEEIARARIAEILRDPNYGGSLVGGKDEDLLCWWLVWRNGDDKVKAAAGVEDLIFDIEPGPEAMTPTVYVTIGSTARYRLPERRLLQDRGREFAPLAQALSRAIVERNCDIALPGEAIDAYEAYLHNLADAPSRAERERAQYTFAETPQRTILPWLRQARKYVWDEDFSELVLAVAWDCNPAALLDFLTKARLPFDYYWVEWHRAPITVHDATDDLRRWGALFRPTGAYARNRPAKPPPITAYEVMLFYQAVSPYDARRPGDGSVPSIWPYNYAASFRAPINNGPPSLLRAGKFGEQGEDNYPRSVLGMAYYDRFRKTHVAEMQTLAGHVDFMVGPPWHPLFGEFSLDVLDGTLRLANPRIRQTLDDRISRACNTFRELMVGLALSVTHMDDQPLTIETPGGTPATLVRRNRLPGLKYTVIRLRRPQEGPKLRRLVRRLARIKTPVPYHPVPGHWAHRVIANDICRRHPRACPRATWEKVVAPEGVDPKEFDTMACVVCHRHRWWVRDHHRGDIKAGVVDHGYEVTATGQPPLPPPDEAAPVEP
jgi:hypothetical protein